MLEFNNFARKLLGLPKRNPDKEHNKKYEHPNEKDNQCDFFPSFIFI